MKSVISEDFHFCRYEMNDLKVVIDRSLLSEAAEIDRFFSQEDKVFEIFNNDTNIASLDSIEELESEFNDFIATADNQDNFRIVITCEKVVDSDFKIYSEQSFVDGIPKDSEEQIRLWNNCFKNNSILVMPNKSVSLTTVKPISISDTSLPKSFEHNCLLPEHIQHLSENFDSCIGEYFKILLAKYCLLTVCSFYELNQNERNIYAFEGYAKVVIKTSSDKEYLESHINIYDVYKLIFVDNNFNTRLGLLRNIISVKKSEKLEGIFDSDIIKVLHSNYQIYLRENIKQYIEIKNKTIELMHGLLVKAADRFEEQQKSYQKVAAALSTYLFSVIIGKFIFKSDSEVFSIEISSISTMFILFSIAYLEFSQKVLRSTKSRLIKNLSGLKGRYKNLMHSTELEEIFNENELSECFSESDSFLSHSIYQAGLVVMLILMWVATGINYNI